MTSPLPSFSIVTATFQAGATIAALARSLEMQDYQDFEWVVQDGGSTDATGSIVESTAVPSVRLESGSDDGIYDAFNRGVSRSTGDYVLFLGADDRLLAPNTLRRAAEALAQEAVAPDVLLCSVEDEDGNRFVSRLSLSTFVFNTVHHQGAFYARSLFDRFHYRTDSKIVADYELNLLLKTHGRRSASADIVVAECASGGVSHTANEWRLYRDLHELRSRHVPRVVSAGFLLVGMANVARRRVGRKHG